MNKKGQAALEFLTTYGWAFLVILIMIGALSYFGVLNPTKYVPDSCRFSAPFTCDNAVITTTELTMKFKNTGEDAAVITTITLTDANSGNTETVTDFSSGVTGTCTGTATELTCPVGGIATLTSATYTANRFGSIGSKANLNVVLTYYYEKSGATFSKPSGGTIVQTVQ